MEMTPTVCPECGSPLPADAPEGSCSTCLLLLGVEAPAVEVTPVDPETLAPGQSSEDSTRTEQAGQRIGRYKLLEKIGEGGFGTVWMAEQQEPVRRQVALKIIKLGMDTKQVVARFEAERQALAMMDHPNIARVFDGGATENGRPFFVMELVRGIPLTTYCDTARLATRERLELFIRVCQAVQHAHQKGIIHRDLKPTNILVTEQDGRAIPKVIDFGIAKATEQKLTEMTLFTQFNQMLGTPSYMSPEQAGLGSLDIDTRTDIYSLGVLLYELLTGRTPLDPNKLHEAGYEAILKTIREVEPPRPSTCLSTLKLEDLTAIAGLRREDPQKLHRLIRGDLDWIALKALEKDRTRRYDSTNSLAADLRRYLDNEPIVARPPSNLYRFQKVARRNKLLFGAAGAVAAALVVGIVIASWQAARANLNAAATRRELYVAQIRLAHQAWQEGHLEQAEKMLEATIPAAGQEDLRDFEWRYLRKLVRDESRLTFADADFKVPAMDSHGMSHPLTLAADGKTLIIATSNTFKWLDMERHRIVRTFEVGTNAIQRFAAVMNPPGLLAYVTDRIHLLASTGDPLPDEAFAHAFGTAIALSSDGSLLAFAETNLALRVLDVRTGKQVGPALPFNKTNRVMSLAFSPDAKYLVCGTLDTKILILEMPGLEMLKMLTGHSAIVECLAFDQVGTQLASGANDSHIRIWRFPDGNPIAHLTGHQGAIGSLAFSPDGTRLASGGWDHTVRLWNLGRGGETTFLHGHRDSVKAILFSKDGAQLYTGSNDGTVKVWAVPSTESTNVLQHSRWVSHVAISPDGTLLAVEDWYAPATVLWDLPSRRRITNLVQHSSDFHSGMVVFSPDGRLLATGGQDEIAQVWNLSEKRMIFEFPKERNSASLAFHSSRPILAVANEDVRFWDFRDGKETSLLKDPPNHGIRAVVFSPNGEWIALTHRDGEVSIWSVTTGQRSSSFHASEKEAFAVCFSHDSAFLASGGADYRVALYDMRRRLIAHFDGHTAFVFGLAFAPGDKSLVSASWDGTVRFWHVANGQLALTLAHDGGPVTSVSFSPDGNLMATTGSDGTVRLWPAVSWAEIGANKP
jgi:WD40 repeat protein/serine/threonine protein kinase